ncbi:MAG: hypothetical protein NZ735_01685 [Candidatus Marinimicrobia bacterium]|nr:hypothetical protein [Candidatus Neomarinimicrobiota bacterium]
MDAKELRVGNAVMLRHADKDYVGTVDDVSLYGINMTIPDLYGETESEVFYDEWNPIPLTEEWLVKFGFVLDKGVGVWFGERDLSDDYGCFTIWDKYTGIDYKFSIENSLYIDLKYAHQLQNLYFSLTGEELTIK